VQKALETRTKFIELIGMVTQAEGLPRISGRILGLLIFDGRPYAFGELATELQVSRGSISSNVRMLAERGAIERVAKPGNRQDYYQICENPYDSILSGIAQRAEKTATDIAQIAGQLPPEMAQASRRVADYASFYGVLAEGIRLATQKAKTRSSGDQ